jgi:hypothetical protein
LEDAVVDRLGEQLDEVHPMILTLRKDVLLPNCRNLLLKLRHGKRHRYLMSNVGMRLG